MADENDEKRRGRSARAAALQARVADVPAAPEPGGDLLGLGGDVGMEPGPDELGPGLGSPVDALDGAVSALEGLEVPPELAGEVQEIVSRIGMLKEKLSSPSPGMDSAAPEGMPPGAPPGIADLTQAPMI